MKVEGKKRRGRKKGEGLSHLQAVEFDIDAIREIKRRKRGLFKKGSTRKTRKFEGLDERFLVKQLKFPFSCPICGRKTDYPLEELVAGAVLSCSFCKLKLTLHGHMLEDIQKEIEKLKRNHEKAKERM